jgi:ribosomal protein S18 acetylase RimI-like enzyme
MPTELRSTTAMDATLRRATEADVPDLARMFIMAADGIVDALYHDLVPGVPTEKLFEWRFTQSGSVKSYEYCWMAQQGLRAIGMVHAFPIDGLAGAPSDPRLTADRLAVLAPIAMLDEQARGSYYINVVAVYPDCRGGGIGNRLLERAMSDARQQGFAEASLVVFEQNSRAVALYGRLGFKIAARSPVVPHPLVHRTGDMLLMIRRL